MHQGVYAHFPAEERPFVARVEDWLERALRRQEIRTPFLDPRQAFILQSLAVHRGVEVRFHGGHDHAERKRALLAPWIPDSLTPDDFGLALLQGEIVGGAAEAVQHRHFLGSLLNTGLKREKVGDLWLVPSSARRLVQVVVAEEVADYLLFSWSKVGKATLHVDKIPWRELVPPRVDMEPFTVTMASLRLDAFVAEVCRLSRAKAVQLVKGQGVKVNWKVEADPARGLQAGDLVAVRKYGRFYLLAVEGESRKGRLRVQVGKPSER